MNEMLRVNRCRDGDMDELINFWSWSGSQSGCRIPFSHSVRTGTRQHGILLRGIGGLLKQQCVVLRHWNTVVGGKCALPSALLVNILKTLFTSVSELMWSVQVSSDEK